MTIHFSCACGKDVWARGALAGKKVKCPECDAILVVPGPDLGPVFEAGPVRWCRRCERIEPYGQPIPARLPIPDKPQLGRPPGRDVGCSQCMDSIELLWRSDRGELLTRVSPADPDAPPFTAPARTKPRPADPVGLMERYGAWLLRNPTDTWYVELSYQNYSQAALEDLHLLPNVVEVNFYGAPVTDPDLLYLRMLPKLRALDLRECKWVTDAGAAHLLGLPALRTVAIDGPRVTTPARTRLAEALARRG